MIILIPMAGAGSRFSEKGYKVHKPAILTTDRRTGKKVPMVVAATMDIPGHENEKNRIIYIDRDFHKKDGVEQVIKEYYPRAEFITLDYLTEGQASTCLLAKDKINTDQELIIAGCDNGMVVNRDAFDKERQICDMLVFTYRNNPAVLAKPEAYGWCVIDDKDNVTRMSVKKPISQTPMKDHAVVATFWFKHGRDFVRATEKMIQENDRINNEFYVDKVIDHAINLGLKVKVFEIDRYIGWGTPKDYEEYEATIDYWKGFLNAERSKL